MQLDQAVTAPNEYWDAIKHLLVLPDPDPMKRIVYGSSPQIGSLRNGPDNFYEVFTLREELVRKYSWSIPDPVALRFVAEHSNGYLVDPIAGTGYWAYLLAWCGVAVRAYDLDPPREDEQHNHWHHNARQFVRVGMADVADSVGSYPAATLFLSWPPHIDDTASRALGAYQGNRLIYIGEGEGGATADDTFFAMLEKDWTEVDFFPITQWIGLHDFIRVFDRQA